MAGRGRGRGRGFGGGGFGGGGYAKQEPFVLFPTDVTLPNIKDIINLEQKKTKGLTEGEKLVHQSIKFLRIWKGSPFYLEQAASKEKKNPEVERFSDRTKPKTNIKRGSLFDILELKGFPQELTGGSKGQQPSRKRARWNSNRGNSERDSAIFDVLEKREANADGKEKKDSEGEDEDQEQEEEVSDEEYFSDNDYQQNQDFDDDDDDFNMEDDGADEPLL